MRDDGPEDLGLDEFEPAARRAVAAAEAEALTLGHDQIGTEHLLLALLADETGASARMLSEAGARLSVARQKVLEALPPSRTSAQPHDGPLGLTARATRALGRSVRFSRERRTEMVTAEDLLTGVLDVEGTAGQVLRGLGVDVDRLRAALDADVRSPDDVVSVSGEHVARAAKPAMCPACGAGIDDDLTYRVVRARGGDGPRDARLFSCGSCGTVIGVAPA